MPGLCNNSTATPLPTYSGPRGQLTGAEGDLVRDAGGLMRERQELLLRHPIGWHGEPVSKSCAR